jgi:hypothetical protein
MFPYQIYQALSDQRTRDLIAEARHHELVAMASHARGDRTEPSFRLRRAAAQVWAGLHLRDSARVGPTVTPVSGAGPMGCSA